MFSCLVLLCAFKDEPKGVSRLTVCLFSAQCLRVSENVLLYYIKLQSLHCSLYDPCMTLHESLFARPSAGLSTRLDYMEIRFGLSRLLSGESKLIYTSLN